MQKKLTGKAMLLFCLGDFSRAIFNGLTATYLMYLFIPAENSSLPLLLPYGALTFALIRGIGVIFDALIDPFIASRSDNCHHKLGARIPFLRFAAIPMGVFALLMVFMPVLMEYQLKQDKIPNKWLLEKFSEKFITVNRKSSPFWVEAFGCDDIKYNAGYNIHNLFERELDYRHRIFKHDFFLNFSDEEIAYAEDCLKKWGAADRPIACFHARDNAYQVFKGEVLKTAQHNDNARNTSIENYRQAMEYLADRDIYSLRMGAVAERPMEGDHIIDYASLYREEMLDFYLLSQCRFFVATSSGIMFMAMFFSTPLVLVNWALITSNMDNMPQLTPDRDLMIPKKLWHTREKRYLSLREQLRFEHTHQWYDIYLCYEEEGIILEENTAEEIRAVVIEMEERLAGKCHYTSEDEKLQAVYRGILAGQVAKSYLHWCNARLGRDFLRNNPWFLS